MTTVKKHKVVTILDILTFLDKPRQGTESILDALQNQFSIKPEAADSLMDSAEELGYIDSDDQITAKGNQYLADCSNAPSEYGVLTLVRGLPGSGKTELGKKLTEHTKYLKATVHIESDQFMVDENGQYKFSIDKVKLTNVECIAQTERYLRMGYDVVVSNAFAQYWEIRPYYDMAAILGIRTVLVEVQSQFLSERRSPHTRQQMVEKWESIFLPRTWHQHSINLLGEPTKGKENEPEPIP